jgi:hypothetical protein
LAIIDLGTALIIAALYPPTIDATTGAPETFLARVAAVWEIAGAFFLKLVAASESCLETTFSASATVCADLTAFFKPVADALITVGLGVAFRALTGPVAFGKPKKLIFIFFTQKIYALIPGIISGQKWKK